ncbi:MAG: GC-type dockerin domain-anchored protein [Phycisphaerales bacterium JB064]
MSRCSRRRCALAIVLAASAGLASSVHADDVRWVRPSSGFWGDPGNWSGGDMPGDLDVVRIGGTSWPIVTVRMTDMYLQDAAALHLAGGSTLDLDRGLLRLDEGLVSTMTGAGTTLRLSDKDPTAPISLFEFDAQLDMGPGTRMLLDDRAQVLLRGPSRSRGLITGWGELYTDARVAFRNDGIIRPGEGNLMQVFVDVEGGVRGRIDLDGQQEQGVLDLHGRAETLRVLTDSLVDDFSSDIKLGPESRLIMDSLAQPWTADEDSRVIVTGASGSVGDSRIDGSQLNFDGELSLGPAAQLRMGSIVNLNSTARADLEEGARLDLAGFTTVDGGQYTLARGAQMRFRSSAVVNGGRFATASGSSADGYVSFGAATEYSGQVVFDGTVRQDGFATSSGPSTLITARTFDMDGADRDNQWTVRNPLVIEADRIDEGGDNIVACDIEVVGGFLPALTIRLSNPEDSWSMHGWMTLAGGSPFAARRVSGSPMRLGGTLEVPSGAAEIAADLELLVGALIALPENTTLRTRGATIIRGGVAYTGSGTIRNGVGGTLIATGAPNLWRIGLANDATMVLGDGAATDLRADRFEQSIEGVLRVALGGYAAGSEHGVLRISEGPVSLAGTLEVSLFNTDEGFRPRVGDVFTIMTAPEGAVTGTFDHVAQTFHAGLIYQWKVEHEADAVVLVLHRVRSLTCASDLDGDGQTTIFDTLEFMNLFEVGDPRADLNGDGSLDIFDLLVFLNAFESGC